MINLAIRESVTKMSSCIEIIEPTTSCTLNNVETTDVATLTITCSTLVEREIKLFILCHISIILELLTKKRETFERIFGEKGEPMNTKLIRTNNESVTVRNSLKRFAPAKNTNANVTTSFTTSTKLCTEVI